MKNTVDTNPNVEKWKNFVNSHPNGNIFQTPEMYDVYLNTKNYYPKIIAIINNTGEILGIMLSVIIKQYSGLFGVLTSRSIIWGGPLIKNDNSEVLKQILGFYNKTIEKKTIYSECRNFFEQSPKYKSVFNQLGYLYEDHLNILVSLDLSKEELWKGIKRNRKDGINKGKKQGFEFEVTKKKFLIAVFYNLLGITFSRIKLPYPKIDFFNNVITCLDNNYRWFILKHDNKPVITLLAYIYKNKIYAFYIGIDENKEFLKLRPVDFFYWKVLEWGIENGYSEFDWMGAGKPTKEYGVRKFKLQFGGNVFEMGRYKKTHNNMLMKIGEIGLKLWKKFK